MMLMLAVAGVLRQNLPTVVSEQVNVMLTLLC
jgi:hypothetical protein